MKTKAIVLLITLGTLVAQALTTEGIWVNDDRKADLRKVVIRGDRVALHTRHGVERLAAEREGETLILFRPFRRGEGALMVLRPLGEGRLWVKIRRVGRSGLRGTSRRMGFHRPRRVALRPYLGEWRMRESLPYAPVRIRIMKRNGRPYIEAWQESGGDIRPMVSSYARWDGDRIVVTWRGRRGIRTRAVIQGIHEGRKSRYRRIRVKLYRPGTQRPVVYHLDRIGRGGRH